MRRYRAMLWVGVLALASGCDDAVGPNRSGSISLQLVTPSASVDGPALGTSGGSGALAWDNLRVTLAGPTNRTATFACAATCEGTIDNLDPGSYAITVEGLVGSEVDQFGQASGISVVAGDTTTATVNWASFRPVLAAFPADTVEVLRFNVAFSAVPSATGYVLQYSTSPSFAGATSVNLTTTTTEIVVSQEAQYYVRVRATNDVVTAGRWSASGSLVALQGVATVTLSPATPTIVDGNTQQFTAEARDGDNNVVSNVNFFWASSNQSVIRIDQTGLATAVGLGTATITAVGKGQPGSTAITVTFGAPAKLAFAAQPGTTEPAGPFGPALAVRVLDARNNLVADAAVDVTLALGANPVGGTLGGTATVASANGVASFPDLSIDDAGNGYTLVASSAGLPDVSSSPFDVAIEFVRLSIGSGSPWACGLTNKASIYCWGYNDAGLGDGGTASPRPFPVRVTGGHQFTAVSVGGSFQTTGHACALRADGAALCWGLNTNGQLGDNTTTNSPVPVVVTGGHAFKSISAGYAHSCGVRTDGVAMCWGAGANGRLGNNGTGQQNAPVVVSGGHTFTMVDAGASHTCGVRATDTFVLCWGTGNSGELGAGGTVGAIPDALLPVAAGNGTYLSVSAGTNHTCAVRTDRQAACWGLDANGQLGNNGTTALSAPVLVSGGYRFLNVSAGSTFSCGASTAGAGWCWGSNGIGQLGNNSTAQSLVPVAVFGPQLWEHIEAGQFTSVGVSPGGGFTWGNGVNGESGDGTQANSTVPRRVIGSR